MAHEDEAKDRELARKRLIEEIKKRAEEAELKRIEEDEERIVPPKSEESSIPPPQPAPSSRPPIQAPFSPAEQRVLELREKLLIALDRRLSEKAAALFSELSALIPNDPELRTYQFRLAVLRENQQDVKLKKKPVDKKDEKDDQVELRAQREAQKKKITELLEQANLSYQREKYEQGLQEIDAILEIDAEHQEAIDLRKKIDRARDLAEEMKQEETRRRAAEAETARPLPPPVKHEDKGDPWGDAPIVTTTQTVFEAPEEKAAVEPRKTAILERVVARASRVHIPVKTILVVLVVAVVGAVAYMIVDTVRNTVFPPKHSLLIFPATSNITDGSVDYLTEGITEDLIGDLSVIPDFRLIAPRTVFQYNDPRSHNAQSARASGVSHFVVWSIELIAGEATFQVGLYDTSNSTPVWASQQQVSLREIASYRIELARSIVTRMGVTLEGNVEASLTAAAPAVEAYDAYLRGQYVLRHPDQPIDGATLLLERARTVDSSTVAIHNALGWSHILAYEAGDTSHAHLHAALRSVQQAVALNPGSARTLLLWAMADHYNGENARALQRLDEAVALAPADAELQRRHALLLAVAGRVDEAIKIADGAALLDPRNAETHTLLGLLHLYVAHFTADGQQSRRDECAIALRAFENGLRLSSDKSEYASRYNADVLVYVQQHDRAAEILTDRIARVRESFVDYYKLGRVFQSAGKPVQQWQDQLRKARVLLQARLQENPRDAIALSHLALVHTRLGEFKDAIAASTKAIADAGSVAQVYYNVARMYTLQKDKAQALAMLAVAMERRYDLVSILDMDFFNLQQDPDFLQSIVK